MKLREMSLPRVHLRVVGRREISLIALQLSHAREARVLGGAVLRWQAGWATWSDLVLLPRREIELRRGSALIDLAPCAMALIFLFGA